MVILDNINFFVSFVRISTVPKVNVDDLAVVVAAREPRIIQNSRD